MRKFGDVFKTLTISRLNIIDTQRGPKTGLKGPKRACKKATVALQLWPFRVLTVALSQGLRARVRKSEGFSGGLKPAFRSGWSILTEVFLFILFTTIRQFSETVPIGFCPRVTDT